MLKRGSPLELWRELTAAGGRVFGEHARVGQAMRDLHTLFSYLQAMGTLQYVSFDLSLARGLDYYTGVIYEAVLLDGTSQLGSIAAGGRYDNLVGMFGGQTPCVGVSVGIERVFTIMEQRATQQAMEALGDTIQVFVASIGPNLVEHRMKVARILWDADIPCEYSTAENPKFKKQLDESLQRRIPVMIVFGEDEISRGVVKIKCMAEHSEVEVELGDAATAAIAAGAKKLVDATDKALLVALNRE